MDRGEMQPFAFRPLPLPVRQHCRGRRMRCHGNAPLGDLSVADGVGVDDAGGVVVGFDQVAHKLNQAEAEELIPSFPENRPTAIPSPITTAASGSISPVMCG